MDIDGAFGWAEVLRLALFFAALWFSFRLGRGYEQEVRKMQDRDRSP